MTSGIGRAVKNFLQSRLGGGGPLWAGDRDFAALFAEIRDRTLVSPDRCFMLYQFARHAAALEGEMAEVGVYRGGTGRLLARTCPKKTIHLCDTFSGMPAVDPEIDLHREAQFADSSLAAVQAYLADLGNLRFYPGFFPGSARSLEDRRFCFVHLDVDIYSSAAAVLDFFYPRLVRGGVIACDDYDWEGCPGVKKALEEFLADKPELPIRTARHQCILIKI